jgi:hypothetical protein
MSVQLENSEAAILDRVIRSNSADWPPAAAEAILGISFGEADLEQMTSLLEKAKDGVLLAEEMEILENYRHVGKLLELMKARARRSLLTRRA